MTRPMLERIKKGNPLYPEAQRLIHFLSLFANYQMILFLITRFSVNLLVIKKRNSHENKVEYIDKKRYNRINKFRYK